MVGHVISSTSESSVCRALLSVFRALLSVCRALLTVRRAVLSVHMALLSVCMAILVLLMTPWYPTPSVTAECHTMGLSLYFRNPEPHSTSETLYRSVFFSFSHQLCRWLLENWAKHTITAKTLRKMMWR